MTIWMICSLSVVATGMLLILINMGFLACRKDFNLSRSHVISQLVGMAAIALGGFSTIICAVLMFIRWVEINI